jgi:hypothetical protein
MGYQIPSPYQSVLSKTTYGVSDTYIKNGVYHFMGCSVLSVNMSMSFNGTSSSVSITLVEDTKNGDLFITPEIPSLWAFSLPRGGVGEPIFYPDNTLLNQGGFDGLNVPFYFAGICTSYNVDAINTSGRIISVTLTDVKEILSGVQCLLSGFSLSQNIGAGAPRYQSVDNVIDIFGYYNYGMESNRNEYGMHWYKILNVLHSVRVRLYDIYFEFYFTGETFNNVPDFYRIDDELIDLNGLIQRITQDSGSDFVTIARKASSNEVVVEFRGIKRTNDDPLTVADLSAYLIRNEGIIESAKVGREFRNEANSSIVIGGHKNSNYVAYPSSYLESMHLSKDGNVLKEDYNAFPADIKVRLFGGSAVVSNAPEDGSNVTDINKTFNVDSGAILPFWGFTPDDHAYPLIEPFLSLDHLVFDKKTERYGKVIEAIPQIKIGVKNFKVRVVNHNDTFLTDDGLSDDRPFAYIEDIQPGAAVKLNGYVRGIPLNTEILRAATTADSEMAFWNIFRLYYPQYATALGLPAPSWSSVNRQILAAKDAGQTPDLRKVDITPYLWDFSGLADVQEKFIRDGNKYVQKNDETWETLRLNVSNILNLKFKFFKLIYELVRQYAVEHMGKKFLVCLPQSIIMQRIWAGLPVPTRINKPEIEYTVDQRGFWENVPAEFDGLSSTGTPSDEEEQIRRKFMAEDGRFLPMVVMDWKPKGNINFNSNGINQAMFQDIPSSEFRPNRIAERNPNYVFISASVNQLVKRPDLALVELSSDVSFDPTDSTLMHRIKEDQLDDEFLATKSGAMKFLWYFVKKDNTVRAMIKSVADGLGLDFYSYATEVMKTWAKQIHEFASNPFQWNHISEKIMDLKAIIIPLTSTWVTYGPWFYTYADATGMVKVDVDESLVPWNFYTPQDVDPNAVVDGLTPMQRLDNAGFERLARTLADVKNLDSASIICAGFPEFGPAQRFGFNSNLTNVSVDFSTGGVKTTYNFATYAARPGTYRKEDYDNVSRARIDNREKLPEVINNNLLYTAAFGKNRFRE